MTKAARALLVGIGLCAGLAAGAAQAQEPAKEPAQPFTLACINNGKTIYFSIDLAAAKWALMKADGRRDSEVQDVARETADRIRLKNPGGAFDIDRKTGAMDLIKGESRRVDRIACRKHDRYIAIPQGEPAANKF